MRRGLTALLGAALVLGVLAAPRASADDGDLQRARARADRAAAALAEAETRLGRLDEQIQNLEAKARWRRASSTSSGPRCGRRRSAGSWTTIGIA
jgi:hypothetical protein